MYALALKRQVLSDCLSLDRLAGCVRVVGLGGVSFVDWAQAVKVQRWPARRAQCPVPFSSLECLMRCLGRHAAWLGLATIHWLGR